jgi:tape measure domain-containing protein
MSDLNARFKVDLSQIRGAFGEIRRLSTGVGGGIAPAVNAQGAAARKAKGQFVAMNQSVVATNRSLSQGQGFASRFFSILRTAARVTVGFAAITVALVALSRRFPVIGEVARKSFGAIVEGSRGAVAATARALVAINNLRGALTAAAGIYTLVRAFNALRGAAKVPTVKFPTPGRSSGGGGRGAMAGLLGPLTGLVAGGAIFAGLQNQLQGALQGAAANEQLEISFEVLTGGLAPARKALGDIRELAENTPLRFTDLAGAGRNLLAFGESADQLPSTLRRIGDVSSAIQAPIGEIAEIYGKARVQGQLFAEDINQLTGRGIPIISEFADILGVMPDQVKKMASEGQIGFPLLEKAFQNLTSDGGVFAGMLEKQSKSITGLWSTLMDRIEAGRTAMGKPINDALRPILQTAIELAGKLKERGAAFGEAIAQGIDFIRASFQTLSGGEIFSAIGLGLQLAFQMGLDILIRGVGAVIDALQDANFMTGLDEHMRHAGVVLKDVLLGAVEAMLRALSQIRGLGFLEDGAINIGQSRAKAREKERERQAKTAEQPDIDLAAEIKKKFEAAGGIFEGSNVGILAELEALLAPVIAQAAKNTEERTRDKTGETRPEKPEREGLIPVAAGGSVAGAFQRAVNLIQGRTVNELVAAEAQKTNDHLKGIAKTSADTKTAAESTARNTARSKPITVNVVPTFGDNIA